ncbi:NUDIX domain-containing protein [Thermogutta sp.]|uniref:NUDIX domain-containing protein n=1 Tax=Thermogutta sp. TaxID=1962930 RepID=UPI00321FA0EB
MNDSPWASEQKEQLVAVAVVRLAGLVLVGRRPAGRPWAGYLEFPGGCLQPGESWQQAAQRETQEETGLSVRIEEHLLTVHADYDYGRLEIRFFTAVPTAAGIPRPRAPFFWLDVTRLVPEDFPPANAPVIAQLRRLLLSEGSEKRP